MPFAARTHLQNRLRQTNRHQGKRERTGQNSVQLPCSASIGWECPVYRRNGQKSKGTAPAWLPFFSHRRYAEHIEIGKSPATPCQRQNPGKTPRRLKSATISSPEGFCSISCLYEQSSPCRRKTWRFSLHRKIYFKQTTGRPGQLSEDFRKTEAFLFKNQV